MIAYIERAPRKTWNLVLVAKPCNGNEYTSAKRLPFASKTEAKKHCAANGIRPYNF